jgi:hypothetical protein
MASEGISNNQSTRIIFMKKLLFCLYALCFFLSEPIELAANTAEQCYYAEPLEFAVDEHFFSKLILQSGNEKETFASIESHLRSNIPFCHRFQFKYPLKDGVHANTFAKVMQIKAQEAHRFVPVITFSQFIAPSHLGFIRNIKIANNGPTVQEHVLVDQNSRQVIFIEEWVMDSNEVIHPGSFAAINSIIEEEGQWYFAGTYFYKDAPDASKFPAIIQMFQKTYENMILFLENEDVDQVYNQLHKYQ